MEKRYVNDILTRLHSSGPQAEKAKSKIAGANFAGLDELLREIQCDIELTGNDAQRQRRRIMLHGFRAAVEVLSLARLGGDLEAVDDALREEIFADQME